MRILGIESSCDDTSVALVEISDESIVVLSQKTASQIEVHKKYGGVVPEIAGRLHAEQIMPVIEEVLRGYAIPDAIAVTAGPGLITGLLVGVEAARALSYLWNIPVVPVNHIEGHMLSALLPPIKAEADVSVPPSRWSSGRSRRGGFGKVTSIDFPALALVVSGGHTELIMIKKYGECTIIGKTLDDAAGECFDKVAALLHLEYPGGPKISNHALTGDTGAIPFPRPMIDSGDYNFSFAGLKTSALYWLQKHSLSAVTVPTMPAGIWGQGTAEPSLHDFCASFEQAIVDVLVEKTLRAVDAYTPKTILLGGGVSANKKLRTTLQSRLSPLRVLVPELEYAMDNGAMIAVAGYRQAKNPQGENSWKTLRVDPQWTVEQAAPHQ